MTDWKNAVSPSLDDFAALARGALAELPEPFKGMAGEVRMRVADFAEDDLLEAMGIDDPFELTGVYQRPGPGPPIGAGPRRHAAPRFLLFRRPILDEWAENGAVTLGELISHVLVHEIGHHFGLSDADIHAAEEG